MPERTRDQVFISYSHHDEKWQEMLRNTLSPMVRNGAIKLWDDTAIRGGDKWKEKIDEALKSTKVAVLLVTPDFLNSDFITAYELPEILKAATEGVTIMWIAVRYTLFQETVLAPYQAVNNPKTPLASLTEHEVDKELVRICERIKAAVIGQPFSESPVTVASPQILNIPYVRNLNFTGRHELLNQLNSTASGSLSAITGMAGVGKTQLAIEYTYRNRDKYRVVWWLRAEESASLALDYASLAERLALPEKDATEQPHKVEAVKRWLEQNSQWLLIFDNAKDNSLIRSYLPQGHNGHVLITSRNPSWGNVARPITVPLLAQSESIKFLLQRTGSDDEASAIALAEALSYLPLALEQAGAYVEETGRTLSYYLELFQKNRSVLLGRASQTSEHQSVVATFNLSLEELKKQSQASVDLMSLFAFFASDNIPLNIIGEEAHPHHQADIPESLSSVIGQPLALDEAVLHLKKYSLVSIKDGNASIHRLVQTLVRDQLSDDDKERYFKLAVGLMSCAFPRETQDVDSWPRADTLVPHVLKVFEDASSLSFKWRELATLLDRVALYLSRRAEYEKARELFESALEMVEAVSGPNSDDAVSVLGNLGNVLDHLGDFKKAQAILERALKTVETNYGPADPKVEIPSHNLGSLLRKRGQLDEAQRLLLRAFNLAAEAENPDPEDIINRANALAVLCTALNDSETAGTLYSFALEIARKLYRPDDLRLLESTSNQGVYFAGQGDHQKALRLFEEALRIGKVTYGENHPLLATIHGNLGHALSAAGDRVNARIHFERALEIVEARFDSNHPDLANPLNNLGAALGQDRELSKALALFHRALRIAEQHFGDTHNITTTIKNNLAIYEEEFGVELLDSGDYSEALTHLSISLEINPSFSAYSHRAQAYFLAQDYEAAQCDLEKALEFNPNAGELRFLKGYINYNQDKYAEALPDLRLTTELLPNKLKAFELLGRTYFELGDYSSALSTLTNAIRLDPDNGFSDHWRGATHYMRDEFDHALNDFLQAQESGFDRPHNMRFIGQTNGKLGNHAVAIPYLTKAIEALPAYTDLYHMRGHSYAYLQNFSAALSDFDRAIESEPRNAHYYHVRGEIRNSLCDDNGALKDFGTALDLNPDNVDHRNWRAVTYLNLRNYQAAVADFNIALESQPTKGLLYRYSGIAHHELGNYTTALENLTKAINLLQDDTSVYIDRARCYLTLGDYSAALQDLNNCKNDPQGTAEFWRAVTMLVLGDEISSSEMLDEAIALAAADSDKSQAISARVALLRRQQDEAIAIYSDITSACSVRRFLAELSALDLLKRLFPDNQQIAAGRAFLETKLSSLD
jgi:tetratricopeptide (TPR) repeat protein